jgi:hypothetical protein
MRALLAAFAVSALISAQAKPPKAGGFRRPGRCSQAETVQARPSDRMVPSRKVDASAALRINLQEATAAGYVRSFASIDLLTRAPFSLFHSG